jgi:hypothetical protein
VVCSVLETKDMEKALVASGKWGQLCLRGRQVGQIFAEGGMECGMAADGN